MVCPLCVLWWCCDGFPPRRLELGLSRGVKPEYSDPVFGETGISRTDAFEILNPYFVVQGMSKVDCAELGRDLR